MELLSELSWYYASENQSLKKKIKAYKYCHAVVARWLLRAIFSRKLAHMLSKACSSTSFWTHRMVHLKKKKSFHVPWMKIRQQQCLVKGWWLDRFLLQTRESFYVLLIHPPHLLSIPRAATAQHGIESFSLCSLQWILEGGQAKQLKKPGIIL